MLLGSRGSFNAVLGVPLELCREGTVAQAAGVTACPCVLVPTLPASRLAVEGGGGWSSPDPAAPSKLAHSGEAPSLVARTPTEGERVSEREGLAGPQERGRAGRSPCSGGQGGPGTWTRELWSLLAPLPPRPHPCLGSQAGNPIFSFVLGPG